MEVSGAFAARMEGGQRVDKFFGFLFDFCQNFPFQDCGDGAMNEIVNPAMDRRDRSFVVIAIDGRAASGKTSTSLRLASECNLLAVSTGAHYRAIALKMMRAGVGSDDTGGMGEFLGKITIDSKISGNISDIAINGEVFDEKDLRAPEVNGAVSQYSAVDEIRKFLLSYQRAQVGIARAHGFSGVVMEGRDITSVVLPDADLKIFLEADADERSLRRKRDDGSDSVGERDKIDGKRTICGEGVYRINTGTNGLDAVVGIIASKIDEILLEKKLPASAK